MTSFNNEGEQIIFETLAKLPDSLFNGMSLSIQNNYTPVVETLWVPTEFAGGYASGRHLNVLSNVSSYSDTSKIIHEFFHSWAAQNTTGAFSRFFGQSFVVSGLYDLGNMENDLAPQDYISLAGCRKTDTGYLFTRLSPVTGYPNPDCGEDFAESATYYVMRPCDLLAGGESKNAEAGKARYNYFRDTIFGGKEYIPLEGCE